MMMNDDGTFDYRNSGIVNAQYEIDGHSFVPGVTAQELQSCSGTEIFK